MYAYNLYLSCDWGTSSFRLRLVETKTAAVLYEIHSSDGIRKMFERFSALPSKNGKRLHFYQEFLLKQIKLLEKKAGSSFKYVPLIFSGMASSSIGLKELPYGNLPFSLKDPKLPYEWLKATEAFPYDLLLISGLSSGTDVLRGEETQVLGLARSHKLDQGLVIIPGTHSKHIHIKEGKVQDFRTFMTGEIFEIISKHSILKHSVSNTQKFPDFIAFRKGVSEGAAGELLNVLFKVRTNTLFDKLSPQSNFYYLSGLIIGSELALLKKQEPSAIYLCGEGVMQNLYNEALLKLELTEGLQTLSEQEVNQLVIHGHMQFLMGLD